MTKQKPDTITIADIPAKMGSLSAVVTTGLKNTIPTGRFAQRFSNAAETHYMTPDLVVIYLARRVGEARQAQERAKWFGGRIYNRLTGTDGDRVNVTGAVLAHAMRWLGDDVPGKVPLEATLRLPFDRAATLEKRLREKAIKEGMID